MTDSDRRKSGSSALGFVYAFFFYSYLRWFTRQEQANSSTNHESELFAWAVLSLNMTMLVNIIVSCAVLSNENALDIWRAMSGWPKFLLFGWSYPIMLYLNYRALITGNTWRSIGLRMESLSGREKQFGYLLVFATSIAIFGGSFVLAFAAIDMQ